MANRILRTTPMPMPTRAYTIPAATGPRIPCRKYYVYGNDAAKGIFIWAADLDYAHELGEAYFRCPVVCRYRHNRSA